MKQTAKVVNTNPVTVIDGGGKVTLSGDGERRILYQNTCDPDAGVDHVDHCQDQDDPQAGRSGTSPSADGNADRRRTTRAAAAARCSCAAAG